MLFVPVPKVACTAVRYLLLELEQEVVEPGVSLWTSPTRAQSIHDDGRYPLRNLYGLSTDLRDEIFVSSTWRRYALTRDPLARLFSAWQDKVLLASPAFRGPVAALDLVVEDDLVDIHRSFRAFVALAAEQRIAVFRDPHFVPQAAIVRPEAIAYTRLFNVSEIPVLLDELGGISGRTLSMPRVNEGLRLPWHEAYDDRTIALAQDMYERDYKELGLELTAPRVPTARADALAVPRVPLSLVLAVRERNERIWDLSREAVALDDRRLTSRIRRLQRRLADARASRSTS